VKSQKEFDEGSFLQIFSAPSYDCTNLLNSPHQYGIYGCVPLFYILVGLNARLAGMLMTMDQLNPCSVYSYFKLTLLEFKASSLRDKTKR